MIFYSIGFLAFLVLAASALLVAVCGIVLVVLVMLVKHLVTDPLIDRWLR